MQAISAVNEGPRLTPAELSAMLDRVLHPTAYDGKPEEPKPEEPKPKPKKDRRKGDKPAV